MIKSFPKSSWIRSGARIALAVTTVFTDTSLAQTSAQAPSASTSAPAGAVATAEPAAPRPSPAALFAGPVDIQFLGIPERLPALQAALSRIAADPVCAEPQPELDAGLRSCAINQEKTERFHSRCVRLPFEALSRSPDRVSLQLSLFKLLFDRELMLLFRLKAPLDPQTDGAKQLRLRWQNFETKWLTRMARHPDVMALDASAALAPTARGSMKLRLDSIPRKYEQMQGIAYELKRRLGGRERPTGFYALATDLLIRSLGSDWVKREYRAEGMSEGLSQEKADEVADKQKNMMYVIYPELETEPRTLYFGNAFLMWKNQNASMLAPDIMKRNANGRFLPIQEQLEAAFRYLNAVADHPAVARHIASMDVIVTRAMEDIVADLDAIAELGSQDLAFLKGEPELASDAMAALASFERDTKHRLQAIQCANAYSDARWARFRELNHYAGYALDAAMLVAVVGGIEFFVGRWAFGKLAGRVLARSMVKKMARNGMFLLHHSGTVMIWLGVPYSLVSLQGAYELYQRDSRRFYESTDTRTTVVQGALESRETALNWSIFGAIVMLAPLPFIIGH